MNPENSENKFDELIRKIINNFHYDTIDSLQYIIKDIESLPDAEKASNATDIIKIKGSIKGYGQVDRPLTDNQIKALNKVLYKIISPVKIPEYKPHTYTNSYQLFNEPAKLSKDEFIYDVIVNLIRGLESRTLTSSITPLVADMEDFLLQLVQSDHRKYKNLYDKISAGLTENGWTTHKGFYSEPNTERLLNMFQHAVCIYFEA